MLEKPKGAMENKESGDNGNIWEKKQHKNKQNIHKKIKTKTKTKKQSKSQHNIT